LDAPNKSEGYSLAEKLISDCAIPPQAIPLLKARVACPKVAIFPLPEAIYISCFNARRSPTNSNTEIQPARSFDFPILPACGHYWDKECPTILA
jgi:hypothetical protein